MFLRLFSPFPNLSHNTVSLLGLGMLLFLRIPFLAGVATYWQQAQFWAYVVFITTTYLLTAFLIWWERDRLREFWIDLFGAMIFLCQVPLFPFGIGLFAAMRRSKAHFPTPPATLLRWSLTGALLAILSEIFMTQMQLTRPETQASSLPPAGLLVLFFAVLTQMTNAAVFEEPLFRSFLWGHLRMAGWKNGWIWLFQAVLFMLAHFYYLRTESFPLFFVRMMIPALLVGLIAWRARSITASMVTHGFINGTNDLLRHTGPLPDALSIAWISAGIITVVLILSIGFEINQRNRLHMVVR